LLSVTEILAVEPAYEIINLDIKSISCQMMLLFQLSVKWWSQYCLLGVCGMAFSFSVLVSFLQKLQFWFS